MKCSTVSSREIRGFSFLVPSCDKDSIKQKLEEYRKRADSEGKTYIVRIADSNYFRFDVLMVPGAPTFVTISTVRGTNNINLRDLDTLLELKTISCCASEKEELKKGLSGFLSESKTAEAEVVDLISSEESEFETSVDCNAVQWNEIKPPEPVEGRWSTSELASTEHLYLKALAGQGKFIAISTERPQNSIKFNSIDRLSSLCCFIGLLEKKLFQECPQLGEALKEILSEGQATSKRRKKDKY
ncbi:MAG: hypothetical protein OWQ54_00545 [Sulfolobaceae archaeon]|nr:hypothetical protein [Sulfolobaceae archaeon]